MKGASHNGTSEEPKVEEQYVEDVAIRKPGFGAKAKRHCSRFWWLHLIIFCSSFLLGSLLLVYVGTPKIAQNGVDQSSLEIDAISLMGPTPNSFNMYQKGLLHSPSVFTPTLDEFNASLYLFDTKPMMPFAILTLPSIHATHKQPSQILVNRTVPITNTDQFAQYATTVMQKEEYRLGISGKTTLHLGALPVQHVYYEEVVTLKGLNGLKGFDVPYVKVLTKAEADGTNMVGKVYIPNPTVMTIQMGDVLMDLFVNNNKIGNSTINDLTLVPGNNTLDMTSITDQAEVLKFLKPDGTIDLEIRGRSSVYNGLHLPYYESALASLSQHVTINVTMALQNGASSGSS